MNRSFCILLAISCLIAFGTGCSSPKPLPANPEDYSELSQKWQPTGSASVGGYACITISKHLAIPLFKGTAHLDPVTSYSTRVFEGIWQSNKFKTSFENDTVRFDPIMLGYRKDSPINDQGVFKFNNVQPGDYYLSCYAAWAAYREDYELDPYSFRGPPRSGSPAIQQGAWLIRRVRLEEGKNPDVMLTQ